MTVAEMKTWVAEHELEIVDLCFTEGWHTAKLTFPAGAWLVGQATTFERACEKLAATITLVRE